MLFLVKTCSKMLSGDKLGSSISVILHPALQNLLGIFCIFRLKRVARQLSAYRNEDRQPTLGLPKRISTQRFIFRNLFLK